MEKVAIDYLLLDEDTLFGINISLIVLGAVIAVSLKKIEFPMRRVSYFWSLVGINLFIFASQFGWAFTPAAAEAGMLSILILLMGSMFVGFGMLLFWASAARSVDIKNDNSVAWMGFIPIINLYLLFMPGTHTGIKRDRSFAARFILDPVLVIGAFLFFGLVNAISQEMEKAPLFDDNDSSRLSQAIRENMSVNDAFMNELRKVEGTMPFRVDDITVLTDVQVSDDTLRYVYDVDTQATSFRDGFKTQIAKTPCQPDTFGEQLSKGGTIIFEYRNSETGAEIDTYHITDADCR